MKGHTFEPGRLIAGATAVAVAVGYGLDAAGTWDPHPLVLLPALLAGLVLAALVTALTHAARRNRRRARQADQPPPPPPLGDLPMASLREGHEALRATRQQRPGAAGRAAPAPDTGPASAPGTAAGPAGPNAAGRDGAPDTGAGDAPRAAGSGEPPNEDGSGDGVRPVGHQGP